MLLHKKTVGILWTLCTGRPQGVDHVVPGGVTGGDAPPGRGVLRGVGHGDARTKGCQSSDVGVIVFAGGSMTENAPCLRCAPTIYKRAARVMLVGVAVFKSDVSTV